MVFHPKTEAELEQLYDDIAERASPEIAWNFIAGIRDHCLGLSTFPQRGTERVEIMPGLRIVGYRRAVRVAFAVEGERVLIPGIFCSGRNITAELLEGRL
ncbi:type II toxin-antitoxin system RelE/ParE family toxin [Mesorhizobium sp. PL10]